MPCFKVYFCYQSFMPQYPVPLQFNAHLSCIISPIIWVNPHHYANTELQNIFFRLCFSGWVTQDGRTFRTSIVTQDLEKEELWVETYGTGPFFMSQCCIRKGIQ